MEKEEEEDAQVRDAIPSAPVIYSYEYTAFCSTAKCGGSVYAVSIDLRKTRQEHTAKDAMMMI